MKQVKMYSSLAIGGATFLGGPIAAGYMIGENFKAVGKPKEGRGSLILGIVSTFILFIGIFMLPESVIDAVPRQLIPLIYTGIVLGIVEWKQGDLLKAHKENNESFFSGWRAAGIGFISLIIMVIGIVGYIFLFTNTELYDKYDAELTQFTKNENESMVFYDHLNTENISSLLEELDDKTIPLWKENKEIIYRTNQFKGLPPELIKQNDILLKYTELRLQAFGLFRKAILEDTDEYDRELDQLHVQIDAEIAKLN